MPDSNVEIVRRAYEAWGRMDMDGASEAWAADIEWDLTHHDEGEGVVARGPAEVMALLAEWMGKWRAYAVTVVGLEPCGDNVVVTCDRRALDRAHAHADRRIAYLWTLREGQAVRVAAYSDVEQARRDAGLTPP
jgi:ketosteroid isomerase-like protein